MFDAAPERRQRRTGLGLTTRLAEREAHSTGSVASPWRRWLSAASADDKLVPVFFAVAFNSFQSARAE